MTTEARQIAARPPAASDVFPIEKTDDWDARADATAEGNVITVVITDHLGPAKPRVPLHRRAPSPSTEGMSAGPTRHCEWTDSS